MSPSLNAYGFCGFPTPCQKVGALFVAGIALGLRYGYFWSVGEIRGHLQSALLSILLLILGFQTLQMGVLSDLIASNRKLLEDALYRLRKIELRGRTEESHERDSDG